MTESTKTEVAIFGGGCFWCTEAVFKMLRGVMTVTPGYAGGTVANPTYNQVCSGKTGHAEVTRVEFDPTQISFEDILTVFFASHDPTSLNKQGNDVGTQYRSAVFFTVPEQKEKVEKYVADLNTSNTEGKQIVTEISPLDIFYPAENYHQDYYANHKDDMYCSLVINPKLDKVQKKFADLLKEKTIQ